jgi:ketosteroid isomerase-like protein
METGNAMAGDVWMAGLFAAIDRRDADAFADLLAEDVVFRFGNAAPVRGRTAAREAVSGFFASVAAIHHGVEDVWRCGAHAICRGVVTYTRADGSTLAVPVANVLALSEGRVREYDIYVDIGGLFPT